MKKCVLMLFVMILLVPFALAEDCDYIWAYQGDVAFFEKDGKIGLIDNQNHILHDAEFDAVKYFDQNGFAEIVVDGRIGRIDKYGAVVVSPVECEYMGYLELHVGSTEVRDEVWMYKDKKNKFGFFSLDGKPISEPQWDRTYSFVNGFAYIEKDNQWNMIDMNGTLLLDIWWDEINIGTNGRASLNNSTKKISINTHGEIYAEYEIDPDGNWKQVTYNGIPCSPYEGIQSIGEKYDIYKQNGLWGLLGSDGSIITEALWDRVSSNAPEGLIWVEKDSLGGWINAEGEYVLQPEWVSISYVGNDRWLGKNHHGTVYIINDHADKVCLLDDNYRSIYSHNDGIIQYATEDGFWGFIDCDGNVLSRINEEDVYEQIFGSYAEGWIQVELNNQCNGYMYVDGSVLSSMDWEVTSIFHNGFAAVRVDGKWGYINTDGNFIVEPVWSDCGDYRLVGGQLIAPVKMSGDDEKYSFINEYGETICGVKQ